MRPCARQSRHATAAIVGQVEEIVAGAADVLALLARPAPAIVAEAHADVRAQLEALVGPGFVTRAGADRLADLRRYVRAMKRRLDQVGSDPGTRPGAYAGNPAIAGGSAAGSAGRRGRGALDDRRASRQPVRAVAGHPQPVSVQRIWRLLEG